MVFYYMSSFCCVSVLYLVFLMSAASMSVHETFKATIVVENNGFVFHIPDDFMTGSRHILGELIV